jgi:hypothetical protein
MLKMLKLPSSTTLHLDCISAAFINDDSEGLSLPIISAQLQGPAPVEFKSLTVTIAYHRKRSLNITASTIPSTLRNLQTQYLEDDIIGNPQAELVLSFDGLSRPGQWTDLLKQASKMLPISNVESISMSAPSMAIDISWVELFSCCTNVTTMQVIGHGTSNLVRALTAPTVTNAGSSKEARKRKYDNGESTVVQPVSTVTHTHARGAIFPKLKFLGLSELIFDEGKHHPRGTLFEVFERGLQQRMAASGEPLRLLRISDCEISTERVNNLRKLVQDFHGDGNYFQF